ncbi:motility associated factor glycosyltransferase family protein [bacterium]|nr:motility associated factor glycosyltransferase family protein [bacterium]
MNNNPILDANLECIARYNPELKSKIMQINSLKNDINFVNTILQEPNIMYNGVYLHNNYGAEIEAKEIFLSLTNNSSSMHIIYGFGLGYLFKEFANNSKGQILIYEPDIEILASVLEVADFTQELSKENVYVFNNFDLMKKLYTNKYKINSQTAIAFLPSYKSIFGEDLSKFAQKLNLVMGSVIINNNYIKQKMAPAVKMLCKNIDYLVKEQPLGNFKDLYKEKTALVVSAGPSLDRDIEIIKKYRENIIIFSVGQALRALVKNGIMPDFVSIIETGNQMSQVEGLDTSNIDLILEPITCNSLHNANFRNILLYPSHTSVPNLIWTDISNTDASLYYSSGTVSYTLLYSAKILGFKNIILSGQDLAFLDGKCYAHDARNTGLICEYDETTGNVNISVEDFKSFAESFFDKNSNLTEEQKFVRAQGRLERIKNNLFFVKSINGKMLPTTNDYASFISQFEEFAQKYGQEIHLYNTSLVGAKINGFKDVQIEEILKNLPKVERKNLISDFQYDINKIIENINIEIKTISEILKMQFTASTLVANFDKEYQNRKIVNETCIKYFKQLMTIYLDLTEIYCKKSKIFLYIHKAYSYDLDACLQDNNKASIESIKAVFEHLKSYMEKSTITLKEISEILKLKVIKLNEMLNTKS